MEKYLINPNQKISKINKDIYGHFPSISAGAFMREYMLAKIQKFRMLRACAVML